MFGLGISELLIILVLVFLIFGAGKLPKVMEELGKGAKAFKSAADGQKDAAKKPKSSKKDS